MGEPGKRNRSHRDHDGEGRNPKRRASDNGRDDKGSDELVVYRILCPVGVIGSVIGKSGKVINAIRQETRAKIKVVDPFPGANHRVLTIYCYVREKEEIEVEDELDDRKRPLCAAQDALLRVQTAIANAVASASGDSDRNRRDRDRERDGKEECQILVPTSQSANVIGKAGATIKRLRSKTRTSIKVISKDHGNPAHSCAMDFDNFVQVSVFFGAVFCRISIWNLCLGI